MNGRTWVLRVAMLTAAVHGPVFAGHFRTELVTFPVAVADPVS
jgi:hypothetical protein